MALGPQNHSKTGLVGPNSIMVVCMDPLGKGVQKGAVRLVEIGSINYACQPQDSEQPMLHVRGLFNPCTLGVQKGYGYL